MTAHSVLHAEHQGDQVPCTHHLGQDIEQQRQDSAERRGDPDRHLPQPEGHDIREGELAQVPQRLGDEEHQGRPANEPARGVDHPVVPAERDEPSDAEERRGAHVVAREGQPVLERAHGSVGGIEVARRTGAARRPVRDRQGQGDDDEKAHDGGERRMAQGRLHAISLPAAGGAAAQPRDRSGGSPRRRRRRSASRRPR